MSKELPDGNILASIPSRYSVGQIISEIYKQKVYEQIEALEPSMTVLDVGASIGIFSLKASSIVGSSGRVIAIEPDPESFAALQENIVANKATNIIPVNAAAWNSFTYLEFNNSVRPTSRHITAVEAQIIVPAEPLDNVLSSLSINQVDFVKIDVEGAAEETLEGMTNTLNNTYSLAIAAYHKLMGKKEHPSEIVALLQSKGFSTKILRYYFGLVPYVYAIKA